MCFKQVGAISILGSEYLNFVDNYTYLGTCISSAENEVDIRLA